MTSRPTRPPPLRRRHNHMQSACFYRTHCSCLHLTSLCSCCCDHLAANVALPPRHLLSVIGCRPYCNCVQLKGSGPGMDALRRSAVSDQPCPPSSPGTAAAPRASLNPVSSTSASGALPRRTPTRQLHSGSAQPPPFKSR